MGKDFTRVKFPRQMIMTQQLDLFEQAYQESLEKRPSDSDVQELHDKKLKRKKLTPRQWLLLNFIKYNSFMEHRKTTQREIYENIDGYEWNDRDNCHDHCPAIWNDIKDINLSYETDKLIISDNFEYWVGNEQETKSFIDKLWNDLEPRLVRYWAYLKKIERDGQGQLLSRKLDAIDENSSAREFIESYGTQRIGD